MPQDTAHPSPAPAADGFAAVLRDHTAAVHRAAERAGFIADLLHGRATVPGYALFLRNLVPAYTALEAALATHAAHPVAGPFADRCIRRLARLEADLVALSGADWATLPMLDEATTYAAAITAAAADPHRLAAHGYARYLGDLSGGQILKPLLARTLRLSADALSLYDFPEIADLNQAKATLRTALDAIRPEGITATRVCAEASRAFRHNIAISEAVQAMVRNGSADPSFVVQPTAERYGP